MHVFVMVIKQAEFSGWPIVMKECFVIIDNAAQPPVRLETGNV